MTAAGGLVIGFLSGAVLGSAFFGALWWTVRGLPASERATRRMVSSFVIRLGLLAVGLALVARLGPLEILAALAGLLAARSLLIRSIGGGGRYVDASAPARGELECR